MSVRRVVLPGAVLAATASLFIVGAGAALAAPTAYPPNPGCGLSISSTGVESGQSVTVTGSGLVPNKTYTVGLVSQGAALGSAAADSSGGFTLTVTVPAGLTGSQTVAIQGLTCDVAGITIVKTPTSAGSNLASTGAPVLGAGIAGIGLLAVGGLVIAAGRRRSDG